MLYMAVDKVIDFIGAIVRVRDVYGNSTADGDGEGENAPAPRPEDSGKQFSLLASQESTVLLKNDGALPVTNAVKVATFGQIAREYADFDGAVARLCNQRGCSYSGHATAMRLTWTEATSCWKTSRRLRALRTWLWRLSGWARGAKRGWRKQKA